MLQAFRSQPVHVNVGYQGGQKYNPPKHQVQPQQQPHSQQTPQVQQPFQQPAQPTTPTEFSGQKNYKPQRGRGQGRGRGNQNKRNRSNSASEPPSHLVPFCAPPQNLLQRPPVQGLVGGSLSKYWEVWAQKGMSTEVVEILRWGARIEFWKKTVLAHSPINSSDSKSKDSIIQEQIESLLSKEAIEEVSAPYGRGFYSRLLVVPKPNGKWQPILDLKRLNDQVKIPIFRMESVQSVWTQLIPENHMFSIDLTDAYFHIPIHPESRKYLRILFRGKVYQFRALPFGLSTASYIFTQVVSQVKALVHLRGIQLFLYLDDWLVQIRTLS